MTPAEHLGYAEASLRVAESTEAYLDAIGHALVAIAGELGAIRVLIIHTTTRATEENYMAGETIITAQLPPEFPIGSRVEDNQGRVWKRGKKWWKHKGVRIQWHHLMSDAPLTLIQATTEEN